MPGPQSAVHNQYEVPSMSHPAEMRPPNAHHSVGLLGHSNACSRLDQASIRAHFAQWCIGQHLQFRQHELYPETQVKCKARVSPPSPSTTTLSRRPDASLRPKPYPETQVLGDGSQGQHEGKSSQFTLRPTALTPSGQPGQEGAQSGPPKQSPPHHDNTYPTQHDVLPTEVVFPRQQREGTVEVRPNLPFNLAQRVSRKPFRNTAGFGFRVGRAIEPDTFNRSHAAPPSPFPALTGPRTLHPWFLASEADANLPGDARSSQEPNQLTSGPPEAIECMQTSDTTEEGRLRPSDSAGLVRNRPRQESGNLSLLPNPPCQSMAAPVSAAHHEREPDPPQQHRPGITVLHTPTKGGPSSTITGFGSPAGGTTQPVTSDLPDAQQGLPTLLNLACPSLIAHRELVPSFQAQARVLDADASVANGPSGHCGHHAPAVTCKAANPESATGWQHQEGVQTSSQAPCPLMEDASQPAGRSFRPRVGQATGQLPDAQEEAQYGSMRYGLDAPAEGTTQPAPVVANPTMDLGTPTGGPTPSAQGTELQARETVHAILRSTTLPVEGLGANSCEFPSGEQTAYAPISPQPPERGAATVVHQRQASVAASSTIHGGQPGPCQDPQPSRTPFCPAPSGSQATSCPVPEQMGPGPLEGIKNRGPFLGLQPAVPHEANPHGSNLFGWPSLQAASFQPGYLEHRARCAGQEGEETPSHSEPPVTRSAEVAVARAPSQTPAPPLSSPKPCPPKSRFSLLESQKGKTCETGCVKLETDGVSHGNVLTDAVFCALGPPCVPTHPHEGVQTGQTPEEAQTLLLPSLPAQGIAPSGKANPHSRLEIGGLASETCNGGWVPSSGTTCPGVVPQGTTSRGVVPLSASNLHASAESLPGDAALNASTLEHDPGARTPTVCAAIEPTLTHAPMPHRSQEGVETRADWEACSADSSFAAPSEAPVMRLKSELHVPLFNLNRTRHPAVLKGGVDTPVEGAIPSATGSTPGRCRAIGAPTVGPTLSAPGLALAAPPYQAMPSMASEQCTPVQTQTPGPSAPCPPGPHPPNRGRAQEGSHQSEVDAEAPGQDVCIHTQVSPLRPPVEPPPQPTSQTITTRQKPVLVSPSLRCQAIPFVPGPAPLSGPSSYCNTSWMCASQVASGSLGGRPQGPMPLGPTSAGLHAETHGHPLDRVLASASCTRAGMQVTTHAICPRLPLRLDPKLSSWKRGLGSRTGRTLMQSLTAPALFTHLSGTRLAPEGLEPGSTNAPLGTQLYRPSPAVPARPPVRGALHPNKVSLSQEGVATRTSLPQEGVEVTQHPPFVPTVGVLPAPPLNVDPNLGNKPEASRFGRSVPGREPLLDFFYPGLATFASLHLGRPMPPVPSTHTKGRRRRAGTQPPRSGSSKMADLWGELAALVQHGTPKAEQRATDVLDLIEAATPLLADTLPHKAATLALESFQGGPPHVAASACWDVKAGLLTSRAKRELSLLTANVTSWRAQLMPWICDQRPDIVLLQETRHRDRGPMEAKFEAAGYSMHDAPGFVTPKDGASGGLVVAYRRH